jgi:hypothetical protein
LEVGGDDVEDEKETENEELARAVLKERAAILGMKLCNGRLTIQSQNREGPVKTR